MLRVRPQGDHRMMMRGRGDDAWSCLLAEALGARVQTRIRAGEIDTTIAGRIPIRGFMDAARASFAGRTSAQGAAAVALTADRS